MFVEPSYFVLVETIQKRDGHESLNAAIIAKLLLLTPNSEVTLIAGFCHFRRLKKSLTTLGVAGLERLHFRLSLLLFLIPKERGFCNRLSKYRTKLWFDSWFLHIPLENINRSFLILLGSTKNDEKRLRSLTTKFRVTWFLVHGSIESSVFGIPRHEDIVEKPGFVSRLLSFPFILKEAYDVAKDLNRLPVFIVLILSKSSKLLRVPRRKRHSFSESSTGRAHLANLDVRFLALSGHALTEIVESFPEIQGITDYIEMPSLMAYVKPELSESTFAARHIGVLGSASTEALIELMNISDFDKISPPVEFRILGEAPLRYWHRSIVFASHVRRPNFFQLSRLMQRSSFLIWPHLGGYRVTCSLSLIDGLNSGRIVLAVQSPMTSHLSSIYPERLILCSDYAELSTLLTAFYLTSKLPIDGEFVDRFDVSADLVNQSSGVTLTDLVSYFLDQ